MKREHTYETSDAMRALFGAWTGPAIGLLDLDAFFASVEMLDHPDWRGKPVIVGGSAERRGVVSTASYEARAYGVRSAMSSAQAQRLCSNAIWTPGNFQRYREVSSQVMAILADETPFVEQVSIDEAFFDVTPGRFAEEDPASICRRIAQRVSELGVSCSIGLGSNKTIAKIASERDKPRGLTVIAPGTEPSFLSPLPVRAMSGIGSAVETQLKRCGIYTLGQLAQASDSILKPIFGCNSELMRLRAQGQEESSVSPIDVEREIKSVSNERTFPQDLTNISDVKAALQLLGESIGARLRKKGLAGRTVTLKLKYSWGSSKTAQRKLAHPTDDENIFVPIAIELLEGLWGKDTHVRLAGLALSDFDLKEGVQTDLFCELDERGAQASERRNLSVTMDKVRERFGHDAVTFGRAARFDEDVVRQDKYPDRDTPESL